MANNLVALKGGGVVAQERNVTSTTKKHTLGSEAVDELGNVYKYLEGIASTALADWVVYDDAFLTARLTTAEADKLKPIAVAQAAVVASQYGWYCVEGETEANLQTSCAKEVALYTHATAGTVDDTSVTKINRAVSRDTITTAAAATVWIHRPSAG